MVVVVIITALSALAIPSIIKQMRDRRTRQAAEEIASLYRQARLRALGRGSAVLVRYDRTAGTYATLEAVIGPGTGAPATAGCVQLPVANCATTNWAGTGAQLLSTWTVPLGMRSEVYADLTKGGSGTVAPGTDRGSLDVCFTPMGRTLIRDLAANPLQTMSGVPVIRVSGADTTRLKRHVVIPPNGLARTDVALLL
jgi:type IV fimbrial biogenesis protein FimT